MNCGAWRTTIGATEAGTGGTSGIGWTCFGGIGGACWSGRVARSCGTIGGMVASRGPKSPSLVVVVAARTAPQANIKLAAALAGRTVAGGCSSISYPPPAAAAAAPPR